ncbi:hypothetical protein ABIE53_001934 [Burkholderia sp. OAS925]|jgi:hypothetical protein|uniref:Uncharacterized protein n=1 Tax=Paraburkholderia graminis TaxID=60548 RepID=A0ABD5CNY1_9BURK|nr:hypothetical protein [Paraburkholderia graminis]MDR6207034.1 hypothetical protein [Paraburkholderia graminis]MDR6466544.1 hypothetical protein [Paraburkholderia graminis]MDR6474180.1 hypothetical protein [Paraburkholderia graminis]
MSHLFGMINGDSELLRGAAFAFTWSIALRHAH